jgi:hypothetical protein
MPLRGDMAPAARPPDDQLAGWLAAKGRATGYAVPLADLRAGFGTWLALTSGAYVPAGLGSEPPPGFGLRDERGAALVSDEAEDGEHPVLVFGQGDGVAHRLIETHRAWARDRPDLDRLRIEAHPAGEEPPPDRDVRILRRPRFTFVVSSA